MSDKIDLLLCWRWTCKVCDTVNHEHGTELPAEEALELGVEEGTMVVQPTSVICTNCMEYYEVKEPEGS